MLPLLILRGALRAGLSSDRMPVQEKDAGTVKIVNEAQRIAARSLVFSPIEHSVSDAPRY